MAEIFGLQSAQARQIGDAGSIRPAAPLPGASTPQNYPDTPEGRVNQMFDANRDANLARLRDAYDRNMSDAQASYAKIDPAYQQKANDLATQYERNRRNFNIQAAGSGLNTGVASQAALAQNSAFQRDYGGLRVAQQDALNEAQRGIDRLTQGYNADVNAFEAQNEYERSKQLLAEQKEAYQNQLTMAATLAKYGDFSGYKGIYSDAQIKQMQDNWIASNPDLAYRTGKIDEKKYKKMTGNWPAGYTPPSSGGGGGGYYSGSGSSNKSNDASAQTTTKTIQRRGAGLNTGPVSPGGVSTYMSNANGAGRR